MAVEGMGARTVGGDDRALSAQASFRLSHFQVKASAGECSVYEGTSVDSKSIGKLRIGTVVVSIAEVDAGTPAERWCHIYHPVLQSGWIREAMMMRVSTRVFLGHPDKYALVRQPRVVWPEPVSDANADVTFTCTFNGRIAPFFEAMESVLSNLADVGSAKHRWHS